MDCYKEIVYSRHKRTAKPGSYGDYGNMHMTCTTQAKINPSMEARSWLPSSTPTLRAMGN